MGVLLMSGHPPDFELRCRGQVFKVHKDIISKHSEVFAKLCQGYFKVRGYGQNKRAKSHFTPKLTLFKKLLKYHLLFKNYKNFKFDKS